MEDKYLISLRNRITGQGLLDIRDLIVYLFCVYGKNIPQQLKLKYNSVEGVKYSIDEPIDIVFPAIEDLIEISKLAGRLYFPQQIADLGYLIISKHQIFRSDIQKWARLPPPTNVAKL